MLRPWQLPMLPRQFWDQASHPVTTTPSPTLSYRMLSQPTRASSTRQVLPVLPQHQTLQQVLLPMQQLTLLMVTTT